MLAFLCVTLQIIGCYFLSSLGLVTPFISCGLTIFICYTFNCSPALTFLFTVWSYFTCFLSNNRTDLNQALIRSDEDITKDDSSFYPMLCMKAGLFLLFLVLPIPKPASYFTGIVAFFVLYCVVFLNSPQKDNFFLGLLGFLLVYILLSITNFFFFNSNLVIASVSGLAISNLLLKHEDDIDVYEGDYPPHPIFAFLALFIPWISPGFSLNTSICAFVHPGRWQSILGSMFSLIIEAWNLGLLCRGELSSKTPLASILTTPTRISQSPIIDTMSMDTSILPAVILFVSLSFAIVALLPSLSPHPHFLIFSFSCQAFLFIGPPILLLLPLSLLSSLILRLSLPHSPHSHSLSILLSMSL